MWCCKTRKQLFKFENGTTVKARDPFKAYEILSSTSLKHVEVDEIEKGQWIVKFNSNVFTELEARGSSQARQAAEWFAYLDRRELKIVAAHPFS